MAIPPGRNSPIPLMSTALEPISDKEESVFDPPTKEEINAKVSDVQQQVLPIDAQSELKPISISEVTTKRKLPKLPPPPDSDVLSVVKSFSTKPQVMIEENTQTQVPPLSSFSDEPEMDQEVTFIDSGKKMRYKDAVDAHVKIYNLIKDKSGDSLFFTVLTEAYKDPEKWKVHWKNADPQGIMKERGLLDENEHLLPSLKIILEACLSMISTKDQGILLRIEALLEVINWENCPPKETIESNSRGSSTWNTLTQPVKKRKRESEKPFEPDTNDFAKEVLLVDGKTRMTYLEFKAAFVKIDVALKDAGQASGFFIGDLRMASNKPDEWWSCMPEVCDSEKIMKERLLIDEKRHLDSHVKSVVDVMFVGNYFKPNEFKIRTIHELYTWADKSAKSQKASEKDES